MQKKVLSNRTFELSDEDEKMLKKYYDDQKKKAKVARDTNNYNELVNTIGKDNLPSLEEFVKIKEEGAEEWDRIKELERQAEGEKQEDSVGESSEEPKKLVIKDASSYYQEFGKIAKDPNLTKQQKFDKIKEAYNALEEKGDVTVIADTKYLKPEVFNEDGRFFVDWPDNLGFKEETIKSVNRKNPLPNEWDRIGGMGGEDFTTLPSDHTPYSYDERAIPYIENPSARHTGTFNNNVYFAAIDAIQSKDLNALNRVMSINGNEPLVEVQLDKMVARYSKYKKDLKKYIGNIDAPYGLKGVASPWTDNAGNILLGGGAEQIVTPLSGTMLEDIGVIIIKK